MAAAQPPPPPAAQPPPPPTAAAAAQPAPPPAAQPAPPPAAAAAAAAQPAAAPVAQLAPPPAAAPARAPDRRRVRVDAATALFVIGCAAAVLALFAMTVDPANSRFLGPCAPTDEEAADLRAASQLLLVSAAAQVVGATVARFAPAQPFTLFACALSWPTAYRVSVILPLLVGCHGHVHGDLAVQCWIVNIVMLVAVLLAILAAIVPDPRR